MLKEKDNTTIKIQVYYLWTEGHIQSVGVILHALRWPTNSDLSRNDGAATLEHWDLRQAEAQIAWNQTFVNKKLLIISNMKETRTELMVTGM